MRCLFLFTFSLFLLQVKGSVDLSVPFRKTRVIEDIRPFQSSYNVSVRSRLECSKVCARDKDCRKYLYCENVGEEKNGWCSVYPDGEDCVYVSSIFLTCSCYQKWKHSNGTHCLSPIGYYGPFCENIIIDCAEGLEKGMPVISLSYVKPTFSSHPFEIFCDRGFSTVQVRTDYFKRQNFNRSWNDYVNGFGYLHSEHWIGLEKIKTLYLSSTFVPTYMYNFTITLYDQFNPFCVITFSNFVINDSYLISYTMHHFELFCPPSILQPIIPLSQQFSTIDAGPNQQCAKLDGGGWWFIPPVSFCSGINVNGRPDLMILKTLQHGTINLKKVVMALGRH